MTSDYNALLQTGTWSLVPPPPNTNIIGNRWIFRIKQNPDGTIARYKARLVAKGYNQQSGIDYTKNFSPMVKFTTIRLVLSLAVTYGWLIQQLDISNAFLHGFLTEDLYMAQPPGFESSKHPEYVCKLHKCFYGLTQALRVWFKRLTDFLIQLGFIASQADHSLFILHRNHSCIFMLIYVDDIIVTSSTPSGCAWLLAKMKCVFPVKDLGALHYFLGIEVRPTINGLLLTQQKYIADLLRETKMQDAKGCVTPMATHPTLSKSLGNYFCPKNTTDRSLVPDNMLLLLTWI
jgi:hypothetical protein